MEEKKRSRLYWIQLYFTENCPLFVVLIIRYRKETACRFHVLVLRVCCKALIEVNSLCSPLICHCKRATHQNATINGRNRNSCFAIYDPNTLRAFWRLTPFSNLPPSPFSRFDFLVVANKWEFLAFRLIYCASRCFVTPCIDSYFRKLFVCDILSIYHEN